jgi:hypothetical protein
VAHAQVAKEPNHKSGLGLRCCNAQKGGCRLHFLDKESRRHDFANAAIAASRVGS